jgi:hypothetical protein
MIRTNFFILACLLIATGCNGNKKICDHARGLMIKDIERDREIDKDFERDRKLDKDLAQDLPPRHEGMSADELADKRVAAINTHFVEKCMELDDKGIRCIKRIDDLRKIEEEAMQRAQVCFEKGDFTPEGQACLDKLRTETDERIAGCDDVIDNLMKAIDPDKQ